MSIPTEPIGSVPRPPQLIEAMRGAAEGRVSEQELEALREEALEHTIAELEATGSPVITDGEQLKPSFVTYPIHGLASLSANGVVIPFADGHTRQLPALTAGRSATRSTRTHTSSAHSATQHGRSSRR